MYAQLGARGSSVLFSSGDFGVGGGSCLTNDGTNRTVFQPMFPASCEPSRLSLMDNTDQLFLFVGPFVTTVGGTTQINPEIVANFSGGGFSNYFSQPSYQSDAVSDYLSNLGDQYKGLYK